MTLKERFRYSDFYRVFNFKTEERKGTSILLINTAISNIANAFVSGALYTAFLASNGIDIVRVGVISFIPYLTWALSVFSPMIMSHIKKRRWVLVGNLTFYYTCVILATTIMPLFVEDTTQKTIWFAVFLFLGNASNALLGSGATAWHLHFIPEGRDRNVYIAYSNICSYILSTLTAVIASLAADALSGTEAQRTIIFILRLVSFVMFMGNALMTYLVPKEYPYAENAHKVRLMDAFTEPVKCKPFLLTTIFGVLWTMIANFNGSTWNYYLLETVHLPYAYLYVGSVACMLGSFFFSNVLRRFIDRVSVFKSLFYMLIVFTALEFASSYISAATVPLFIVIAVISGLNSVGYNLAYGNLFYLNLPEDSNKDVYATFWNLTINVSAFVGCAVGTWILSFFESHGPWTMFGVQVYGSQFLTSIKGVCFLATLFYMRAVHNIVQPKSKY